MPRSPWYRDRLEAGRRLAAGLERERGPDTVVVGLARGGVQVASEVARALGAPLDALAVRKVGHPLQPEYAVGAVAPGGLVVVRGHDGLTDTELAASARAAAGAAEALDRRLHREARAAPVSGKAVLLVDDGLATGATMIAAARWARAAGARRVVAAVPVGAVTAVGLLRGEVDDVVCTHCSDAFGAVGLWYRHFDQVDDDEVVRLLREAAHRRAAKAAA